MFKCFFLCAGVLLGAFFMPLAAQNISIGYQTPDSLDVCWNDTLGITIRNNTALPVAGALLDLEMPTGLEYLPGSTAGASESDISNLEKPVFALPNLPPGASINVRVLLSATCGLVDSINSNKLFDVLLRVRAGAVVEQVTTTKFQIQTSLLVITQVDNSVLSGEKGDVLTRTLHVRNTRLGPVRHLFLRDAHSGGIQIHVAGAVTEQNDPTLYTAYFDGTFFSQFGDGDALLDFNETVLIKQEIEITDCGFPVYNCRSNIAALWSCAPTDSPCQGDSTFADVQVSESTFQPNLTFQTHYALPWDHCAELPHQMRMRIVNQGPAPATNLVLQINSEAPGGLGMDKNSFRLSQNGQVSPLPVNLTTDFPMEACGDTASGFVTLFMPEIPGHDTVDIAFDAYYCMPYCTQIMPKLRLNYFYNKPCPPSGFVVADTVTFEAKASDYLTGVVQYGFSECLRDGETYSFTYRLNSTRFLTDTGYLFVKMDLPRGLEWSPDCPPLMSGKTPVVQSITPMVTTFPVNRVLLAFELPLSNAFSPLNFCLKNTCQDSASYIAVSGGSPTPGVNFFSYTPEYCLSCGYEPKMSAVFSQTLNVDLDCAWGACDSFQLQTECMCTLIDTSGIIDTFPLDDTTFVGCRVLTNRHEAYRLNYDLPDNNDDRRADATGAIDFDKVRRDRFLPGDTVRNIFNTRVDCGDTIKVLFYQIFTEIVASDFGYAGVNDTFNIGPNQTDAARFYFTDLKYLEVAEAVLTVWDSETNAVYSCPVSTMFPRGGQYGQIGLVNTKPVQVVDELTTANFPFYFRMDSLRANGCLPQDFLLNTGDSVELRVDLKLGVNYNPKSKTSSPPLINFEMGYNANRTYRPFNYHYFDTLMMQFSGYVDSFSHATFGIRPCEPSQQVTPFAYDIRIARENLFPFEVRPLSKITNYDLVMNPPGLVPQSATLLFLNRQTNTPLLQNVPLPFSLVPDSMVHVDLSPAYAEPIDEGYGLRTRLVFEPSCRFTQPDSSAAWVTVEFPKCMAIPDSFTHIVENKLGFYSNHPKDTITTTEPVLNFPTGAVSADLTLRNLAPAAAPNYWIQLVNPEGGLTNPSITILNTGAVVTPANGLFQLGTLPVLGQQNLRISALNTTCDPQRLLVIYGWNCLPVTQPEEDGCAKDTLEILLRPRQPEIELDLVSMPVSVPLCDTSDYFVLEISNADLGHAYKPVVHIELPAGLQLLPGSCELSYPAGSAYVSIPDPTDAGNGQLEWNLAALQGAIAAAGLQGVNAIPQNALRIRFRVAAECGSVSNAQLIFGARAEWYCGKPTNSLRKASPPILVEGAAPTYSVQIGVVAQETGPVPCHTERTLSVSMLLTGSPLPGDSMYVELPSGYTYVPGSYQPGINAQLGEPQVAGNVLRWPFIVSLPSGSTVQFSFRVLSGDIPACDGAVIRVQARQRTSAFCPTINDFCTIYLATGERLLSLPPYVPAWTITGATGRIGASADGVFTVDVANTGANPAVLSVLQIVRDVDGDGQLSPADTIFFIGNLNQSVAPGDTQVVTLSSLNPLDLCNLLVVIPAGDNCACDTVVLPVTAQDVTYTPETLCLGDSVLLGLSNGTMAGHTYTWSGTGAPGCTDCTQFQFQPPGAGAYALTLTDTGPGCTVLHAFSVQVFAPPALLVQNTAICRGQQVLLETSAATAWQWSGPGISNSGAATQTVQPQQSAVYYVTATGTGGCVLTDSVLVTVYQPDTTDAGILRTCEGTPVDVFGALTETPGEYRDTLTNANGCDSLVLVVLEVVPNTESDIFRCAPDTVVVFGIPVTAAGTYCDTIASSLGCDSIHCVTVRDFPIPSLPEVADTIYFQEGTSVVLSGPGGYAGYQWTPTDWLDCPTCPSPTATPPDTITYTLVVFTGDNCPDSVLYFLIPFPPCDPARISMPNTFTPDGDGVNDTFAPVVHEGVEVVGRLTIYNRWGQKVYESENPNAAWDGTTFGEPAPSDVYVWLLEVLCTGEERKLRWGDVTVLR